LEQSGSEQRRALALACKVLNEFTELSLTIRCFSDPLWSLWSRQDVSDLFNATAQWGKVLSRD
jgi:hypothetical protein|tara:strand:+ start:203 stop:391 length:189 start_codon:yes stop_codon:yes gene_type:complete